jgi:hypothetical protein
MWMTKLKSTSSGYLGAQTKEECKDGTVMFILLGAYTVWGYFKQMPYCLYCAKRFVLIN